MATKKQIESNRRNALRSTGPRTAAGKAIASANAMSTGLHAARHVVLAALGESETDHDTHTAAVTAQLAPVGPLEAATAHTIAGLLWRLRRIPRFEAAACSPSADLPVRPEQVAPDCPLNQVRPTPTAPAREHLARVRHDLQCNRVSRDALTAALARLRRGLRPASSDDEFGIPEALELQEAASLAMGDGGPDYFRWESLSRRLGEEVGSESALPWTAPRLSRAFDLLAVESGQTPARFRRAVRKKLEALLARQEFLIAERDQLEERLVQEVQAEHDRGTAVAVFASERAIVGIHKAEQHLTRMLERNLDLFARLQSQRRQAERDHDRSNDSFRVGGAERASFGFVFPTSLPAFDLAAHRPAVVQDDEQSIPVSAGTPDPFACPGDCDWDGQA